MAAALLILYATSTRFGDRQGTVTPLYDCAMNANNAVSPRRAKLCRGAARTTQSASFYKASMQAEQEAVHRIPDNPSQCLLSVGICGYEGYNTLRNTLRSYQRNGLLDFADQTFIYYQGPHADPALLRKLTAPYGNKVDVYTSPINVNKYCIREVARYVQCRYFLFLEEDWELTEDAQTMRAQLSAAIALINTTRTHLTRPTQSNCFFRHAKPFVASNGHVSSVRLRSRSRPGNPNWAAIAYQTRASYRKGLATRPMISSRFYTPFPNETYGPDIWSCPSQGTTFYCADGWNGGYTLNPFLMRTAFWDEIVEPFVLYEEDPSDRGWVSRHFVVAAGEGLFTHSRLDRGPLH